MNIIVLLIIMSLIYVNTVRKKEFNLLINKCDINISRNALDSAETILKQIIPFASTRNDYKRIIKRSFILSNKTGESDFFLNASERAFNEYQNDNDLLSIYLHALLQMQRYEDAFTVMENNSKREIPESLSTAIYSSIYKKTRNPDILENIDNKEIVSLLKGANDSDLYEKLYQKSGKPIVLNNYLLSLLSDGYYGKSSEILRNSIYADDNSRELSALVYYDNKEYAKSGYILSDIYEKRDADVTDTGILMLLADTYIYTDEYGKAEEIYKIVIFKEKNFSWIPYVNTDWINLRKNEVSFNTEEAMKLFPLEKELVFLSILKNDYINILNSNDNAVSAEYSQDYRKNQDGYIYEFWNYFNESKMTEEFEIFFAKELYRMKRFNDLSILINKKSNSGKNWALFFSAVTGFSEKNYTDSLQNFTKYHEQTGKWQALFNMGIIYLINNDYNNAIESFTDILKYPAGTKYAEIISEDDLSDIFLMIALSYLYTDNLRESELFLDKAVKAGNRSLTAIYMQNYYKSKIVDEHLY